MEKLISKIEDWAEEKGIYAGSTALNQLNGAIAELYEFREAVIKAKRIDEIRMELGDVVVQLVNYSAMQGVSLAFDMKFGGYPQAEKRGALDQFIFRVATNMVSSDLPYQMEQLFYKLNQMAYWWANGDLEQCTTLAYNKIKDRKGKMLNGKWQKEL